MVDPINRTPIPDPNLDDPHKLSGRPVISVATFRDVAVEVANRFRESVAICRRPETTAGVEAVPFVSKFLRLAQEDGSEIVEIVHPSNVGSEHLEPAAQSLHDRLGEELRKAPGGQQLDGYFGISSGPPQQSTEEAMRSDALIRDLGGVSDSASDADLSELFTRNSAHVEASGVDPETLRNLIRGSKKRTPEAQDGLSGSDV